MRDIAFLVLGIFIGCIARPIIVRIASKQNKKVNEWVKEESYSDREIILKEVLLGDGWYNSSTEELTKHVKELIRYLDDRSVALRKDLKDQILKINVDRLKKAAEIFGISERQMRTSWACIDIIQRIENGTYKMSLRHELEQAYKELWDSIYDYGRKEGQRLEQIEKEIAYMLADSLVNCIENLNTVEI